MYVRFIGEFLQLKFIFRDIIIDIDAGLQYGPLYPSSVLNVVFPALSEGQ